MATLSIDGGETGVNLWANGVLDNTVNKSTGVATRVRQGSWSWPFLRQAGSFFGVGVGSGGNIICSAYCDPNGTLLAVRGNLFAGGVTLATGAFASVPAGVYTWLRFDFFLDGAVGSVAIYQDGVLACSASGVATTPGPIFTDYRMLASAAGFNTPAVTLNSGAGALRSMPDGRRGNYSYQTTVGTAFFDDLVYCAPSLLLQGVRVGVPVAGNVITGGTSGATITVSDFDAGATFQGVGTSRIWGYSTTGTFVNGEALSGGGLAAGVAYVPTAAQTHGLEPQSDPLTNWFVFPMVSTADSGPNQNTVVGGLPNSWQVAAQVPPNSANYLEDSAGVNQTDMWTATTNTLVDDTIGGVQMFENARQTDASIPNIQGIWVDATGTNTASPFPMPTSFGECAVEAWGMRNDGTAITPADVSMNTGVTLAT